MMGEESTDEEITIKELLFDIQENQDFIASLFDNLKAYYEKVNQLEGEKYDMEKEVELKDYRVRNNQNSLCWIIIYVRDFFLFYFDTSLSLL